MTFIWNRYTRMVSVKKYSKNANSKGINSLEQLSKY